MAEKKITKREKFEMLLALVEDNDMLTEFINHEIDLLSSKSGKVNAKRNEEQEMFFEVVRDVLSEATAPMTVGAMLKDERIKAFTWSDGTAETSSSRLTAMLTKMKDKGDLIRTLDKKTPLYSLA